MPLQVFKMGILPPTIVQSAYPKTLKFLNTLKYWVNIFQITLYANLGDLEDKDPRMNVD